MNKLPFRNWSNTLEQTKNFGKIGIKSATTSKRTATKIYKQSKTRLGCLKDKLPKKSIYKKRGYF